MRMIKRTLGCVLSLTALLTVVGQAADQASAAAGHTARIGDVMTVEGVRDNPLVGYGLIVGLSRSGDSQQTFFSAQTVASALRKMGVQLNPSVISQVQTRNAAAVFVTAQL